MEAHSACMRGGVSAFLSSARALAADLVVFAAFFTSVSAPTWVMLMSMQNFSASMKTSAGRSVWSQAASHRRSTAFSLEANPLVRAVVQNQSWSALCLAVVPGLFVQMTA
mmetsp:Transcript_4893/g.11912  ORF Transcript_4893/g.11912 Transcript_4893/m.11912 type:complete len:110 (+) Transcript_4893:538-867(+)